MKTRIVLIICIVTALFSTKAFADVADLKRFLENPTLLKESENLKRFEQITPDQINSPEITTLLQSKLKNHQAIPQTLKPFFLLLSSQHRELIKSENFYQLVAQSLNDDEKNRIIALALLSRKWELFHVSPIQSAFFSFLLNNEHITHLTAYWLAIAVNSVVRLDFSPAIAEAFIKILSHPKIDLQLLCQGIEKDFIISVLKNPALESIFFKPSRYRTKQIEAYLGTKFK